MSDTLPCSIYKSPKRDRLYLFITRKDDFSVVPEALLASFGKPQFVMQVKLHPGRKLAISDVGEVLAALREKGFYLQMPPSDPWL